MATHPSPQNGSVSYHPHVVTLRVPLSLGSPFGPLEPWIPLYSEAEISLLLLYSLPLPLTFPSTTPHTYTTRIELNTSYIIHHVHSQEKARRRGGASGSP